MSRSGPGVIFAFIIETAVATDSSPQTALNLILCPGVHQVCQQPFRVSNEVLLAGSHYLVIAGVG